MGIDITLGNIANLQDTTTAASTLNANSATIVGGLSTALDITGDQMLGALDMNSNQIFNLPAPATSNSPMRLQDAATLNGGGIIAVPQFIAGSNISVNTGTTVTISVITGPVFSTVSASTITVNTVTASSVNVSVGATQGYQISGSTIYYSDGSYAYIRGNAATPAQVLVGGGDAQVYVRGNLQFQTTGNIGGGAVTVPGSGQLNIAATSAINLSTPVVTINGTALGLGNLNNITATTIVGNASATSAAPTTLSASSVRTITEQGSTLLNFWNMSTAGVITDNTSISGAYNTYLIVFDNVVPATNTTSMYVQLQTGGTTNVLGYVNGGGSITSAFDLTQGSLTVSNSTNGGLCGAIYLHGANNTTNKVISGGRVLWVTGASGFTAANVGAFMTSTGAVNGIVFTNSFGGFASGTVKIYGLRSAL